MKAFLQSLRLPFAAVTVSAVLLGTAAAYFYAGEISAETLFTVLGVVICGHISANLFNDFFDHLSGNDRRNKDPTPLNGGSRVIQDKLLKPIDVFCAAFAFGAFAAILGLAFVLEKQSLSLAVFGASGLLLGFAYTAPPIKLAYRSFGEIAVALAFGPFTVGGAYLAQTGTFPLSAWLLSIPAGFLTAVVLLTNEIPDRGADKASQKHTFVVRYGVMNTMLLCATLVSLSYAIMVFGAILCVIPLGVFTSFLSVPLAWSYLDKLEIVRRHFLPAGKAAIALNITFVLFTAAGIAAQRFFM